MYPHSKLVRFGLGKFGQNRIDASPKKESNYPIHGNVRMTHIEISKVPDIIGEAESLKASLCRANKVKNHTHKHEGKHIRIFYGLPTPPHRHQEIGGAGQYRDKHP